MNGRDRAKLRHPANYHNLHYIYGPADFDQAVRDAQKLVDSGRQRLQLVTESRERRARWMDALAVALLMLLCAALGVIAFALAAPAKADNGPDPTPAVLDYVDMYGEHAICTVIDEHHTTSGLLGVMLAIQKDGFTAYEVGQIVGLSITEYCPRNYPLMRRFIDLYSETQAA